MADSTPTNENTAVATQSPAVDTQTANTAEITSATRKAPGSAKIREKRAFTATVVTFALTALLCFMASFLLITGTEDKYGVIPSAVTVTVGAINFYFGTKNGGTNV